MTTPGNPAEAAAPDAEGSASESSTPVPSVRYGPDAGQPVPVSDLVEPDAQGTIEVIHHQSERFYELLDDGMSVGLLIYEKNPRQTGITHAVVREDRRGHGLGRILIASALNDLTASGTRIANYCNSVARFLDRNPDYRRRIGDAT